MARTKIHFSRNALLDYIRTISEYDRADPDSEVKFKELVAEWSIVQSHFSSSSRTNVQKAPLLLVVVLEVSDDSSRRALLATKIMSDLVGSINSVGPWIAKRFAEESFRETVFDYLREVSIIKGDNSIMSNLHFPIVVKTATQLKNSGANR